MRWVLISSLQYLAIRREAVASSCDRGGLDLVLGKSSLLKNGQALAQAARGLRDMV